MTTKIAVSLPDHLVAQARRAVQQGQAASVSAYVAAAMAARGRHDSLARVLADLDAEHGPVSDDDHAWARTALGLGEA